MDAGIKFKTVDEYFSAFPDDSQVLLTQIREIIRQAAPAAKEVISYNMPAFKQNGILVYYAINKNHIGFYPTSRPIEVFKNELSAYKTSKGAIQFPIDKPIPTELITKIVKFRMNQDIETARNKKK